MAATPYRLGGSQGQKRGDALAARAGNHEAVDCRGLPGYDGYWTPATTMPRLLRHQIGARCPIWIVNSLPLPSTVVGPLL